MWWGSAESPRYKLTAFMCLLVVALQFAYIFRASVATARSQEASPPRAQRSCLASGKGGKLPGSSRDCAAGQGPECTLADPCTPCAYGGCLPCSPAYWGDCGFLPGLGPYCLDPITGVSGPCTQCCT